MGKALDKLLLPFNTAKAYWYLVPRAFWPYPDKVEGVPGFHRFLEILLKHQEQEKTWSHDSEMEVLIMLEDEDIIPRWEEQEDFHAHFRNRVNFAKKMGFAVAGMERPLKLTPVGEHFLNSSPEHWPEIFEHQLIKLQFTNPTMPSRYESFCLFPYIFTISLLLDVEGNSLTFNEFTLRVILSQKQDEKEEVLKWVNEFRALSESEQASAKTYIDLNHSYASRMVLLLFAYSPTIDFSSEVLFLKDRDRAHYILAKSWPHLVYTDYPNLESWEAKFGNFDSTFWPLYPQAAKVRQQVHRRYIKREESDTHKAIKRYFIENAEALFGKGASLFEEEYLYASGDSANLVFYLPPDQYVTIEVEVDVGKDDIAGLLQAIKYKYMFAVQEKLLTDQVKSMLVAKSLHPSVKAWCSQYGIDFMEIPLET
ncbi:AlwI family type II restriction endonuclease [candidate division NPL-UPA2 bacterium]|nr:AlwI family type II restriction endonuclease [candidate division NPL-UPA2 bacterium]